MATDSETEASAMGARFQNCPGLYHRLNVDTGLEEVSLEEWEKLGDVKTHTMAYLNEDAVSREIDIIVDALVGKPFQTFPLNHLDGAVAGTIRTTSLFLYPSYQVLHFIPRKNPLKFIHQHFQESLDKTVPTIVVLLGMGGCGKSQLALEYCRQGEKEEWFSTILWLDANSPTSIAQSFNDIACKLSKPNFNMADNEENIRFVLDIIKAWQFRWLLVFDNFDDPSSFSGISITQYFPQSGYGAILFTSRHAITKNLGQHIEVTTMLEEEALQLLLQRSIAKETDENRQEGEKIVKRLGYHTLAINQAGAYILAHTLNLSLFMIHFSERKEKVLNEIPELWDYRRKLKSDLEIETELIVSTTWELSVELISGSPIVREDKVHILTLAGFLDSKEVSDELFRYYSSANINWLPSCKRDGVWDKYELQDILKELSNLSLIQNLQIKENETTFSLHPLIQDWVKLRINLSIRREFALEVIRVLSLFIESRSVYDMSLQTKQALSSHLEVVLQNDRQYTIFKDNHEKVELLDFAGSFGLFFYAQGRYNLSEQMYRYDLKGSMKALGKENPNTIITMNNLAVLLQRQGQYDEAEPIYRETLQLCEKVLGKEHPNTLASMYNLADVLRWSGKIGEARQLFQEELNRCEILYGPDHIETIGSRRNLADLDESCEENSKT